MWLDVLAFFGAIATCFLWRGLYHLLDEPTWYPYTWIVILIVFANSPAVVEGIPVLWGIVTATASVFVWRFIDKQRRRQRGEWVE